MKTRKLRKLKDLSKIENRLAIQYMAIMREMITEGSAFLSQHSWLYRAPLSQLTELAKHFQKVEALVNQYEASRPLFVRSAELKQDYSHALARVKQATAALNDIELNKMQRQWENEAARLQTAIHAHQLKQMRQQSVSNIELYRRLREEDEKLRNLTIELQQAQSKCFPSGKKLKSIEEEVNRHDQKVRSLNQGFDREDSVDTELEALHKQFDIAYKNAKHFAEFKPELKKDALEQLSLAKADLARIKTIALQARSRHYRQLDDSLMKQVANLHASLVKYAASVKQTVTDKIIDKGEVVIYQQHLDAGMAKLNNMMPTFWSAQPKQKVEQSITKKADAKPQALPPKEKEEAVVPAATVTTNSIFKRSVDPVTAAKRQYLKRTNQGDSKHVRFAI